MIAPFDFKNPDYAKVFQQRAARLVEIRKNPQLLNSLKIYYADHIDDFINDWGVTYDPRNSNKNMPTLMPFILYPKQRECTQWMIECYRNGEPGIIEKSRTVGMSWLSVGIACGLCVFKRGVAIGMGSRKQEYVDDRGNLKSWGQFQLFLVEAGEVIPSRLIGQHPIRSQAYPNSRHHTINYP